jgi:hypothetical protein
MGGQGLTAGCSAVGGMEWQVLWFSAVPIIFINSLKLRISPAFSLIANFSETKYLHSNFWHQNAAKLFKT